MTTSAASRDQAGKQHIRAGIIESYRKHQNIKLTCMETGCSPYTAFIILKKTGLLSIQEKISYGTPSSKNGAMAEDEFQRLVPRAVSANRVVQNNCPSFDFMVGETSIDVKYAALRRNGNYGWSMCGKKLLKPDFVVVFLAEKTLLQDGYRILLLPEAMFPDNNSMSLSKNNTSNRLLDFEIQPQDLQDALLEHAGLIAAD